MITCLGRSDAGEHPGQVSESGVRLVIYHRLPVPNKVKVSSFPSCYLTN